MIIELEMLNDESICVGDLKRFLSTIPDNYTLTNKHMNVKFLKIKTDKEYGDCEINLGAYCNETTDPLEGNHIGINSEFFE